MDAEIIISGEFGDNKRFGIGRFLQYLLAVSDDDGELFEGGLGDLLKAMEFMDEHGRVKV